MFCTRPRTRVLAALGDLEVVALVYCHVSLLSLVEVDDVELLVSVGRWVSTHGVIVDAHTQALIVDHALQTAGNICLTAGCPVGGLQDPQVAIVLVATVVVIVVVAVPAVIGRHVRIEAKIRNDVL